MNFSKKTLLNLLSVYIIWGSTYLAIKYAIADIPPFFVAAFRFLSASAILYAISLARKEPALPREDLKTATISGCLLVLGNALVCYVEKELPSGLVAVIIGTMPAWIILFNWRFFGGARPETRQMGGIALALVGIFFLSRASSSDSPSPASILTWTAMIFSLFSWAFGTLVQRRSLQKNSLFRFSALQLLMGGSLALLLAFAFDGAEQLHLDAIRPISVLSVAYLSVLGSVVAFTSYLWLSRNTETSVVSSYALVNPVVAVWLGWMLAGESVSASTFVWSALVLFGLYFIIMKPKTKSLPADGIATAPSK